MSHRALMSAGAIQRPGRRRPRSYRVPTRQVPSPVSLASIPVQVSPTNKVLNVVDLAAKFNHTQLEKLVQENILAVESREGFRVVKGVTTSTNVAWRQITTRRIVDYAIYGVRAACSPYIGKLNNERVRGAMKATLDGFLTRMVEAEALTGYQLSVTATRANEIAGQAIVDLAIQPTFSIDYVDGNHDTGLVRHLVSICGSLTKKEFCNA